MGLPHLVVGMGFGILCAAACLTAGLGWQWALAAYAIGGGVNLVLLVTAHDPFADTAT